MTSKAIDPAPFMGRTYSPGGCYDFARDVLESVGLYIPADQSLALAEEVTFARTLLDYEACRAGDLVLTKGSEEYDAHVGVCVDAFNVLSLETCGPCSRKLATLAAAGLVVKRLRLLATEPEVRVDVLTYSDPLTRVKEKSGSVVVAGGPGSLARVAALMFTPGTKYVAAVNGSPVAEKDLATRAVCNGDLVMLAPGVGDPANGILIGIGLAAALIGSFISPRSRLPSPSGNPEADRFTFSRFSVDAIEGDIEPVLLGEARIGGKLVAALQGEGSDGAGDSRQKMLLCLSHGEIEAIGSRTSDFDNVDAADITGVYLNDQPIASFPGCRLSGRMGTSGQAVLREFEDTEIPREVGVGGIVLRNTSGSERTGGSASGEAVTFDTVDDVDQVVLRIRLGSGLFSTSATGQLNPRTVKYRYRTRLNAGPGAWSAWEVVTVTQARQSEFYSSPRSATLNGGTAARHDVQVERVSVEPATLADVDTLTWDQVVGVRAADNTYAGYAVLALDLVASEQLQASPRVSVDAKGILCRVWDGVSSPSSPTFSTAYTNNPMALALELITNATWGAGALYTDANVDLASLFECWAKCDVLVARPAPSGGTRKRFTYNKWLNAAQSFDEQLLEICRAARVTPLLAGGVWRFVMDDVQASPVERFGDGSIALESDDADAAAEFEYVREARTGGAVAPNRMVAQIENGANGGLPATVAFPALGTEWLGSPLSEPVHEQAIRLEGITDLDQAAQEVKYQLKLRRFQTREVTFRTSRPVIAVQPGERFDVAMSLPAWGLASGRVLGVESGFAANTTTAVAIDRTVTLVGGRTYNLCVTHLDGSYESRPITSAAGVYARGTALTVSPALSAAPLDGAEYSIGESGIEYKPFICTRIEWTGREDFCWRISGVEYNTQIYDDSITNVEYPDYSTLRDLYTPPGPVTRIVAYEADGVSASGQPIKVVTLAYTQRPEDAQITASFRVFRRRTSDSHWVQVPQVVFGLRSATLDITDLDIGYAFKVIAVSAWGSALSPYDPAIPEAVLTFGLSAPPPPPPDNLACTATSGNTYTLSWDAEPDAVAYQVLFGGDTGTGEPNGGAEDCLVLARPTTTSLAGLELPPSESCTFWVRSVGANGRMSTTASVVTVATPATPSGQTIKQSKDYDFTTEGTRSNLTVDGTRLVLTNPALSGTWTGPEEDPGSLDACELTFRPHTENNADDPLVSAFSLFVPSIEADQWGVRNSGLDVGMLFPPYPDAKHVWTFEVRTHDGSSWGAWGAILPCAAINRTFRKWQVRFTIARGSAPYRPAMNGLSVVVTH